MNDSEFVFRVTAAALMGLGFGVRIYHQRRFRDVQRDAPRGKQRDRVYYYLVLGSFLLVFVYAFSSVLDFAHVGLPAPARWTGAVLAVASLALFVACHRALGRNFSGVVQLATGHVLVTHGPYRYIRHPMYASVFGTAIAFALLTANGVIALTGLGSVVFMYVARVADEERMMLQAFGDSYEEYRRRTGRLLPKLGR
jgi:protein-S-isoprenylcysteine O-methyltransferase Ste14